MRHDEYVQNYCTQCIHKRGVATWLLSRWNVIFDWHYNVWKVHNTCTKSVWLWIIHIMLEEYVTSANDWFMHKRGVATARLRNPSLSQGTVDTLYASKSILYSEAFKIFLKLNLVVKNLAQILCRSPNSSLYAVNNTSFFGLNTIILFYWLWDRCEIYNMSPHSIALHTKGQLYVLYDVFVPQDYLEYRGFLKMQQSRRWVPVSEQLCCKHSLLC